MESNTGNAGGAPGAGAQPEGEGAPAGWYPDPRGGGYRYWDGRQWTQHVRAEQVAPGATEPEPAAEPRAALAMPAFVAIVSGVVLLVSMFLEWYSPTDFTAGGETVSFSEEDLELSGEAGVNVTPNAFEAFSGFDIAFLAAAVAAIGLGVALLARVPRTPALLGGIAALGLSLVAAALIVYKLVDPASLTEFIASQPAAGAPPDLEEVESEAKVGTFVALVASLGCAAGAVLAISGALRGHARNAS
jgi:hypothetical protein